MTVICLSGLIRKFWSTGISSVSERGGGGPALRLLELRRRQVVPIQEFPQALFPERHAPILGSSTRSPYHQEVRQLRRVRLLAFAHVFALFGHILPTSCVIYNPGNHKAQ